MKLIHFADLHLGTDNYGSADSASGLNTRVLDFLSAFDAIIDRAIGDDVDAMLFAGDAFKNRDPNSTLQRAFAHRINRLSESGIPIVLLVGNHDVPGTASRAASTEIYDVLDVPGVLVCRNIDMHVLPTKSGELQIVAVPWITRGLFLQLDTFRGLDERDLDERIGTVVGERVRELVSQLNPALPAVMLAHVSLVGASYGLERAILLGNDLVVGQEQLLVSAFDYVALGHIHKHQMLRARPPVVYSGSPERVDFGEEGEDKGYVYLEICQDSDGSRLVSWEFVKLPVRPFRTIRIDAKGGEPLLTVEREISRLAKSLEDAVVRCYIRVDPGRESSVSPLEVRRLINQTQPSHLASVAIESEASSRARMTVSGDEALDPLKMLKRWTELQNYDAELRERVICKGATLIARQRD